MKVEKLASYILRRFTGFDAGFVGHENVWGAEEVVEGVVEEVDEGGGVQVPEAHRLRREHRLSHTEIIKRSDSQSEKVRQNQPMVALHFRHL